MNKIPNRAAICEVLMEQAKTDKDIVVLCSDSRGSASLTPFANAYPKQFVEVGIAEQNLVSISAGLAKTGKKVFCASPASFLSTRSYEQAKVDVAYSNTNVKLIGISGGVSYGALGMSHHSAQDIAAMSAIPNMRVYGNLCFGTVDSYLLFAMTHGKVFQTDYSNASRTQLFNLHTLTWDETICQRFGVPMACLPEVCFSDSCFGKTTLEGVFPHPVPVHAMLGDSHAALFGHGCHHKGQVKTTYGTGSSIMMHTGDTFGSSTHGLMTSLAWGRNGTVSYVLEGNLNYTGAIITWLKDDLNLISSAGETEALALAANPRDTTYLVPAFSGLGAPYWDADAQAMLCGMNRGTGKNEIVKAALDAIAYQITDVLEAMQSDSGVPIQRLCVDGGPTKNRYLMQTQSDIASVTVAVTVAEELSAMGAAFMAGIACGLYQEDIFGRLRYAQYEPAMPRQIRAAKYDGWKAAVGKVVKK